MRRMLVLLMAFLIGGGAMKVDGKEDGSFLRDITTEYRTPHLEWAPELSGGRLNALFIVPRKGGREVVEVCQRMGLEFQAVTTFNAGALAQEDMYESSVEGTTKFEKETELLTKLDRAYDLVVLGNFAFDSLPQEAQFKILSKVSDGTGLLVTYDKGSRLKKIFANPIDGAEEILNLAPRQGLPASSEKTPPQKFLRTCKLGKGRIAAIDYGLWQHELSLTSPNQFSKSWSAVYENNLVLVMRAMLWAAGRKPSSSVSCPQLAAFPELERRPLSLEILCAGVAGKRTVKARLRNEFNACVLEKNLEVVDGKAKFEIEPLPAGRYYLDLMAANGKGVEDFGYCCFSVKSQVGKTTVATEGGESFAPGKPVKGSFEMENPLAVNGKLEIKLVDSPYGRVWHKSVVDVKPNQKKVEFAIDKPYCPTIAAYLECSLSENGKVVAGGDKLVFFPQRARDIYFQFAWDTIPSALSPFYASQVVDKCGWNAGLSHPTKDGENARNAALFNQRFVPYITRIGLTVDEKVKGQKQYSWFFLTPEDQKVAAKLEDQSFYNPEIRALWAKGIENRMTNLTKYGPAVYNLGDENFFNYADSFSPSDEAEFKNFLKRRYGDKIERLNGVWGSAHTSFDEIKTSIKEAKDKKIYPAWFDIRLFWERQYADIHHFLADEIKKRDPEALVGAEGSVPGDLEHSISKLEFWGPYSDTVMDEVLRSIGGDKIRTLWWGGYVGGSHYGRNNLPTPLWKFLLTGSTNGSAWYSAAVASCDGMTGADTRFADYFKGMIPHLDGLRNGIAQLLIKTPLKNDSIAIFHSHASSSARLLDPRFVNPNDSTAAFIEFCYSKGLSFDFLTGSRLAEGLRNHSVLFLFGASAVSEEEAAIIVDYVKNGGTVIADINPGLLDSYLKPAGKNMLEPLFGDLAFSALKNPELSKIKVDATLDGVPVKFEAEKGLSTPDLPLLSVRPLGKGKAILLNFQLRQCPEHGLWRNVAQQVSRSSSILREDDALPRGRGEGAEPKIVRIRDGGNFKLIGLLCDRGDIGKELKLTIPDKAYLYEVGKGSLGRCQSWNAKLDIPFKLFAIYDAEQKAPEFALGAKELAAGGTLKADISKIPPGTVLSVKIKDPDGATLPLRDTVVVVDGKTASFDIRFACSDKPGKYSICVKSVNTGLESTAGVTVK